MDEMRRFGYLLDVKVRLTKITQIDIKNKGSDLSLPCEYYYCRCYCSLNIMI